MLSMNEVHDYSLLRLVQPDSSSNLPAAIAFRGDGQNTNLAFRKNARSETRTWFLSKFGSANFRRPGLRWIKIGRGRNRGFARRLDCAVRQLLRWARQGSNL